MFKSYKAEDFFYRLPYRINIYNPNNNKDVVIDLFPEMIKKAPKGFLERAIKDAIKKIK